MREKFNIHISGETKTGIISAIGLLFHEWDLKKKNIFDLC